jgi:acyl-CoA dehydrogenase
MTASTPPVGPRQAWAREFADEAVGPVGHVLDRMDSHAAAAPGSPVFDLMAQAHREGFTRLSELGLSRMAEYAVLEELASADAGLAAVLVASPLPFRWAAVEARPEWIGCSAPGHGAGSRVRAVRDAGGWLLHGSTSAWVTGAAYATHALLVCAVEGLSHSLAFVPLERPGVRRGPPLDLLGLRAQGRARIVLDGVRLSLDELVPAQPGEIDGMRALAHASAAAMAVGIARAAYDGTLRVAHEDVFDDRVLLEHDDVRRRLMRMVVLLEAARSIAGAVFVETGERIDAGETPSVAHAAAAHAFATEATFEIVDCAMVLCGGRADAAGAVEYLDGSTFHPQKLLRDAQSYTTDRRRRAWDSSRRPTRSLASSMR